MEPIEAATLELAKRSGLPVPEFEIRNLGKRKALLVKRFDISDRGGRYHMISMQTLLQAQGYYFPGYQNMFDAVKAHSYRPSVDVPPDLYEKREHSLSFPLGAGFLPPDGKILQRIGESLKLEAAGMMIDRVRETVSGWKKGFKCYNVPESDIRKLEWGINRRIESLGCMQP